MITSVHGRGKGVGAAQSKAGTCQNEGRWSSLIRVGARSVEAGTMAPEPSHGSSRGAGVAP